MEEYKRPTNEIIIDCLMQQYGIISDTAKKLQVSRQTLARWIHSDPELSETLYEARENLVDKVESQLLKNIEAGKEISTIFALKCLGKKRGYIDTNVKQIEVTSKSVVINFEPQNFQEFKQVMSGEEVQLIEANTSEDS